MLATRKIIVPPDDAFDDKGHYQRALDRRIDTVIKQPIPPRFDGMIPVYLPKTLALCLAIDDGSGAVATLEIALDVRQFDEVFPHINGKQVWLYVRSVRPETSELTMEKQGKGNPNALVTVVHDSDLND